MPKPIRREVLVSAVQKYPWDTFLHSDKQLIVGDARVGGTIDFFNDTVGKIADYLYQCCKLTSRQEVILYNAYAHLYNTFFYDKWQDNDYETVWQEVETLFKSRLRHIRECNKALQDIVKLIIPFVPITHPLWQWYFGK
jgi:hypothetical protein